jgi:hypothetical protein
LVLLRKNEQTPGVLSFKIKFFSKIDPPYCTVGWVDIGTRTKVPLRLVTYLSKVTKINEKVF